MPLARYFLFVGGALLVLLLISAAYLPSLPVAERTGPDPPVIRIHSDRKWPERVVYDTDVATMAPAQVEKTEADVPVMGGAASTDARARETFAQLQSSDAKQLQSSDANRQERALQHKRKNTRTRAALVRRQPRFWHDTYNWWAD